MIFKDYYNITIYIIYLRRYQEMNYAFFYL